MKTTLFTILFIFYSINAFSDYNFKEDKQQQINYFKVQLAILENKLEMNSFAIEFLNKRLKEIDKKIVLLSQLLQNTSKNDTKENILEKEAEIIHKKEKVDRLKSEFLKRILWLYKYGLDYQTQIIFTSESPLSFYTRLEYLNRISGMRKQDYEKIKFEEYSIQEKKKMLNLNKEQQKIYIYKKKEESDFLISEKNIIEDSLKLLKFDNECFGLQIDKIKSFIAQTEMQLNSLTENFIYKIDDNPIYSGNFASNKGRIIFPVQSVEIIRDFGRYVSQITGTISYNFGIDVSIASGSQIKAVFDGIVEDILFIPFYQTVIIINHGDGFRTVYGMVKDLKIQKGTKVNAGDVIGYTSSTSDEQMFHFEIRKDFTPLDPKLWLKTGYSIFIKL